MYLGSDAIALSDLTSRISYLDEGDWVVLSRTSIQVYDADDRPVDRPVTLSTVTGGLIDKGNHRHYMQKEIYEQPTVVAQTLGTYIRPLEGRIALPELVRSDLDPQAAAAIGALPEPHQWDRE